MQRIQLLVNSQGKPIPNPSQREGNLNPPSLWEGLGDGLLKI